MKNTVDMTRGPIFRQMSLFAFPVLIGMLFQRIYNFVDAFIVGRYLGDAPLAAVSISGTAMYMLYSIMMGLTTGVGVVMAQYYGARQEEKVKETFASSVYVALAATVVITVIGLLTAKPLLRLLQTSDALMADASIYLIIIYAGAAGTMLYNWISSVLRAMGNSVVPLAFLVLASVLNVVLDILLVVYIPMGVAGAAIATVASQVIAGVGCLIYAFKILPMLRLEKGSWKLNRTIGKQILRYGMPTGLQMSIISISDMALQAVVNTYGTALIVAYGVCLKVEGMGFQLADAIGSSLGTFAGQNVGARDYDRVKKGVRAAYLLNIMAYGIFCPVVFFASEWIMKLFTKNHEAIRYGTEYMKIFSIFFLMGGILVVFHNVLRASGDITVTVLMGASEVVTRISFAFLFSAWFGYYGLWWVSPVTWICAMTVGGVRYYSGAWKKKAERLSLHTEGSGVNEEAGKA